MFFRAFLLQFSFFFLVLQALGHAIKYREFTAVLCYFLFSPRERKKGDIPEADGNDNCDLDRFDVPRTSRDPEQISFGRELITFCRSYGIHILNGRKEGDIDGKITCIQPGAEA